MALAIRGAVGVPTTLTGLAQTVSRTVAVPVAKASDPLVSSDELTLSPTTEAESQRWVEKLPPRSMLEFWVYAQELWGRESEEAPKGEIDAATTESDTRQLPNLPEKRANAPFDRYA